MNSVVFLDTGPLGIATNPKNPPVTVGILNWAAVHIAAGNRLMVPAIADFELRRELLRQGRSASVAELDTWNGQFIDRYVAISDSALKLAAELWANVRNAGKPTADPKELDCDAMIAAQALDFQREFGLAYSDVIVATVNVGHLSRFCRADLWRNIVP